MLIAETLRSSTFKVALIWIAGFGAVVIALFGFVYSSTASYVLNRSDRAIDADRAVLVAAYQHGGRDELIATIGKLAADQHLGGQSLSAGRLRRFGTACRQPQTVAGGAFRQHRPGRLLGANGSNPEAADQSLLRAQYETLADGSHLLVGRNVSDFAQFARKIYFALASVVVLIFVLAVVAGITVTRRTVGRIESINATSRAIMQSGLQSGLGERVPLCGSRDEWDQLAENLNSMLDRIEVLMGEVKQATDNVAHDLRTPLTRMRGRLESASARVREPGAGPGADHRHDGRP